MSIVLNKQAGSSPQNQSGNPPHIGGGADELRMRIGTRVFDSYCDSATRSDLLRQAVTDCGLTVEKAEIIIDMEFESSSIVNEKKLLNELDAMLHQFTDKDKKLDSKERNDSMQFVCKARPGYSKGLKYDLAERYTTDFCRAHRVKVKIGIFSWSIP